MVRIQKTPSRDGIPVRRGRSAVRDNHDQIHYGMVWRKKQLLRLFIVVAVAVTQAVIGSMDPVEPVQAAELVWEAIPDAPVVVEDVEPIVETARAYLDVMDCHCPEYLLPYFEDAGAIYGIRPELLEAICWRESRFNMNASNGSCKGLMQVSTQWHSERMRRLGFTDIINVQANIMTAADYLHEILEGQPDVYRALMVYNGDSSSEISRYAKEIVAVSMALEIVNGYAPN